MGMILRSAGFLKIRTSRADTRGKQPMPQKQICSMGHCGVREDEGGQFIDAHVMTRPEGRHIEVPTGRSA